MEVQIAVAKVGKYATGISGDSVEVVERPCGGVSVVIVDGQGAGRAAKRTSHMIATKAASLIEDGARDGAVMRVLNDHLYAFRDGQVSATVTLLTADLDHGCLVVSRNSNSPVAVSTPSLTDKLEAPVDPIGVRRLIKPVITHFELLEGTILMGCTDGVIHAGRYLGQNKFCFDWVHEQFTRDLSTSELANEILAHAIALEDGKPRDDMVVAVLALKSRPSGLGVRKMSVTYPF